MGLFSSSSKEKTRDALIPFQHPLGVFPQYTSHNSEYVLKLREKRISLSGDSFDITDVHDQSVLKCTGSVLSIRDKKTFHSADGRPLFNIQQKLLSIHKEFRIYAGDSKDKQICTVKSHLSILSGAKMTITFTNAADGTGKPVEMKVEGDFFDRNAKIYCGNQMVARIDRSFLNSGQLVFGQQTYYLTVAGGVDIALMAAVCVCLDEKANEK